jgi:BolA protein
MGPLARSIHAKLTALLSPLHLLSIRDTSALHAEHAEMRDKHGFAETHFEIEVVSERFRGMAVVERHRLVYGQLGEEFERGLHAVSIKARAPE